MPRVHRKLNLITRSMIYNNERQSEHIRWYYNLRMMNTRCPAMFRVTCCNNRLYCIFCSHGFIFCFRDMQQVATTTFIRILHVNCEKAPEKPFGCSRQKFDVIIRYYHYYYSLETEQRSVGPMKLLHMNYKTIWVCFYIFWQFRSSRLEEKVIPQINNYVA